MSSVDSYRPSMCARKAPLQRALSKRKSFSLAKTGRVVLSDGDSVDEEDDEDDEVRTHTHTHICARARV